MSMLPNMTADITGRCSGGEAGAATDQGSFSTCGIYAVCNSVSNILKHEWDLTLISQENAIAWQMMGLTNSEGRPVSSCGVTLPHLTKEMNNYVEGGKVWLLADRSEVKMRIGLHDVTKEPWVQGPAKAVAGPKRSIVLCAENPGASGHFMVVHQIPKDPRSEEKLCVTADNHNDKFPVLCENSWGEGKLEEVPGKHFREWRRMYTLCLYDVEVRRSSKDSWQRLGSERISLSWPTVTRTSEQSRTEHTTDSVKATQDMLWQPSPGKTYRVALIDGGQAGHVPAGWFESVQHGESGGVTHMVIKTKGNVAKVKISVGKGGRRKGERGTPSTIEGGFEVLEKGIDNFTTFGFLTLWEFSRGCQSDGTAGNGGVLASGCGPSNNGAFGSLATGYGAGGHGGLLSDLWGYGCDGAVFIQEKVD